MTDKGGVFVVIDKYDTIARQVFNVIDCYFGRTG